VRTAEHQSGRPASAGAEARSATAEHQSGRGRQGHWPPGRRGGRGGRRHWFALCRGVGPAFAGAWQCRPFSALPFSLLRQAIIGTVSL
jgi:hypothetical protein